jgi:hypothetical protein
MTKQPQAVRRMTVDLNRAQTEDWIGAVESVDEIAASTDSHSSSKAYIDPMARFVRDEPQTVVRLLTLV